MKTTRKYAYKDADMLLAAKTIAHSLAENLPDLYLVGKNWTEEYADRLNARIDTLIDSYLGFNFREELNEATTKLEAIQLPAMRNLSFLKVQIEADFKEEAPKLLENLGFNGHLREVQRNNQGALVHLLYTFKMNLTDTLKQSLIDKGTNPELLDRTIAYANLLHKDNGEEKIIRENFKEISEETVNAFNQIYNEVIGICEMASNFYQLDPLKKELFTFEQVVANMNVALAISHTRHNAVQ